AGSDCRFGSSSSCNPQAKSFGFRSCELARARPVNQSRSSPQESMCRNDYIGAKKRLSRHANLEISYLFEDGTLRGLAILTSNLRLTWTRYFSANLRRERSNEAISKCRTLRCRSKLPTPSHPAWIIRGR